MSQYTKGPWYKQSGMLLGVNGEPVVAAGLGLGLGGDNGDGVRSANAKLIAAAPELLEALEDVVSFWEQINCTNDLYVKARAAIQKATS